jgi:hypothetical protein
VTDVIVVESYSQVRYRCYCASSVGRCGEIYDYIRSKVMLPQVPGWVDELRRILLARSHSSNSVFDLAPRTRSSEQARIAFHYMFASYVYFGTELKTKYCEEKSVFKNMRMRRIGST